MELHERLRKARKEKGLTQDEVAAHLGLSSRSTVSHWEKGVQGPSKPVLAKLAELYSVSVSYLLDDYIEMPASGYPVGKQVSIPILGTIRAGVPIYAEENIIGYAPVDAHEVTSGDYYYLHVEGDSMAPEIREGDRVLVKAAQTCNDGEIAVCAIDGEVTLKKLYRQDGGVVLYGINPAYPPIHVKYNDIKVYGCVKNLIRKY